MISSAIASGSVNFFGIKRKPGRGWDSRQPWNRTQPPAAIAYLRLIFVCDEPATEKH
jgi:hypothetical protein